MDISNGPGIRVALFVQGCTKHCKGCFNESTWDFAGGKEYTAGTQEMILSLLQDPHIQGLSILGGEPLESCNLDELQSLIKAVRLRYPTKDIWLWTGNLLEDLSDRQMAIVNECDYVVDGPFMLGKKDPSLQYRGSSNQRVIHIRHNDDKV